MPKNTRSQNKASNALSNPVILGTIITGIVTIAVALINILPQLSKSSPTPVLIVATPTEPSLVPTIMPTVTATQTAPAPTEIVSAATDVPVEELPPQINCLDQWEIINPEGGPDITPVSQGQCKVASIPGITTSSGGLSFIGTNVFKGIKGIYGIAVKVPSKAVVEFSAHLSQLYNADFWVGISSSLTPQDNMMILAMRSAFQA